MRIKGKGERGKRWKMRGCGFWRGWVCTATEIFVLKKLDGFVNYPRQVVEVVIFVNVYTHNNH